MLPPAMAAAASERSDREWLDLRSYLRALGPEVVHFHPNPGNGGDALIALATLQLFDECGVRYRIWRDGDETAGETIVYGGGGNLVPPYPSCAGPAPPSTRAAR